MIFECLQTIHFTPVQFLQCFCAEFCDLIHIRILFCLFVFQCGFISFQMLSMFICFFDAVIVCVWTGVLCAHEFDGFIYYGYFRLYALIVVDCFTIFFFQLALYFTKFIIMQFLTTGITSGFVMQFIQIIAHLINCFVCLKQCHFQTAAIFLQLFQFIIDLEPIFQQLMCHQLLVNVHRL